MFRKEHNLGRAALLNGGGAIILCFIVAVINFWFVRYNTYDDMLFALSDYDFWIGAAEGQGRLKMYFSGPLAMVPHLIHSIHYLSAIRIMSWFIFIFMAACYLARLAGNKYVFPLAVIIISLLWSNSIGGHNLVVAYPFYISVTCALFMGSLILIHKQASTLSQAPTIVSAVILFATFVAGGELFFQYVPLLLICALINYVSSEDKRRSLLSGTIIIASITLAIFVTLTYRIIRPSSYAGNTSLNLEPGKVFDTYTTFTVGLFPGVQVVHNWHALFREPNQIATAFLIAAAAFVFLALLRRNLVSINLGKIGPVKIILVFAAFLAALCAPNILVSLTAKYQDWVQGGANNYLYSSMSYVAFALLISFVLLVSARKKLAYYPLISAAAALIFLTQLNNLYVGSIQKEASKRWELFEAAIQYIRNISGNSSATVALSESFFTGIPLDTYWQEYSKKKFNYSGSIKRGGDADVFLSYHPSFSAGGVMLYGTRSFVSAVFTTEHCSADYSCYLVKNGGPSIDLLESGYSDTIRKFALDNGTAIGSAYSYVLTRPIDRGSVVGVLYHDFWSERDRDITVSFSSGIDGLEGVEGNYWRWARAPAEITINSKSKATIKMSLSVTPVQDMKVDVSINDVKKSFNVKSGELSVLTIDGLLSEGGNHLKLGSDSAPIRLNEKDPRYFSFKLTSIKIEPAGQ
jgi:hypothetical protein